MLTSNTKGDFFGNPIWTEWTWKYYMVLPTSDFWSFFWLLSFISFIFSCTRNCNQFYETAQHISTYTCPILPCTVPSNSSSPAIILGQTHSCPSFIFVWEYPRMPELNWQSQDYFLLHTQLCHSIHLKSIFELSLMSEVLSHASSSFPSVHTITSQRNIA